MMSCHSLRPPSRGLKFVRVARREGKAIKGARCEASMPPKPAYRRGNKIVMWVKRPSPTAVASQVAVEDTANVEALCAAAAKGTVLKSVDSVLLQAFDGTEKLLEYDTLVSKLLEDGNANFATYNAHRELARYLDGKIVGKDNIFNVHVTRGGEELAEVDGMLLLNKCQRPHARFSSPAVFALTEEKRNYATVGDVRDLFNRVVTFKTRVLQAPPAMRARLTKENGDVYLDADKLVAKIAEEQALLLPFLVTRLIRMLWRPASMSSWGFFWWQSDGVFLTHAAMQGTRRAGMRLAKKHQLRAGPCALVAL
eukprot:jgi/Chlat1/2824/Chrsp187S02967